MNQRVDFKTKARFESTTDWTKSHHLSTMYGFQEGRPTREEWSGLIGWAGQIYIYWLLLQRMILPMWCDITTGSRAFHRKSTLDHAVGLFQKVNLFRHRFRQYGTGTKYETRELSGLFDDSLHENVKCQEMFLFFHDGNRGQRRSTRVGWCNFQRNIG
jgi:hypothetical protein